MATKKLTASDYRYDEWQKRLMEDESHEENSEKEGSEDDRLSYETYYENGSGDAYGVEQMRERQEAILAMEDAGLTNDAMAEDTLTGEYYGDFGSVEDTMIARLDGDYEHDEAPVLPPDVIDKPSDMLDSVIKERARAIYEQRISYKKPNRRNLRKTA